MDAIETILTRKSVRQMMPDKEISKDEIIGLLEVAAKTASWSNSQPWEVFVVSGDSLVKINEIWREEMSEGIPDSRPDLTFPHREEWQQYKRYQDNVIGFGQSRKEYAEEIGIGEEEWMKMTLESLSNNYFSSALVILALHESATTYSHYDLGAFATNFMLAAEEMGYSTITAASIVFFADRIREVIDVPEDIKLVVGIGIGYADEDHPLNKPESPRNSPEKFTRFFD